MAYTIVFLNLLVHSLKYVAALSSIPSGYRSMNINMPDVSPRVHDSYLCTAKKLNTAESYIIQYEPDADGTKAHHMLLFGCSGLQSQTKVYPSYWKCGGELCTGMTIIYGWAKNAPSMKLPPNVGHLVGGNSSIQYLVLQIHYASAFPEGMTDNSGLKLHLTAERQPFITGIYLLMSQNAVIPPYRPKFYIDVNCKFQGTAPIHVFAYRVHTHKLGTVVSGYKLSVQNNSWSFLAKGNPQWPQAFYPVEQVQTVTNSDILASRCTYNSSGISYSTHIGSTANDEMCNLYLMYYTEYRNSYSEQIPPCIGVEYNDLSGLPAGNDQPLPRNLILEQQVYATHGHGNSITYSNVAPGIFNNQPGATHSHFSNWNNMGQISDDNTSHSKRIFNEVQDTSKSSSSSPKYNVITKWPSSDFSFGQISAVAINKNGNVVIFHRGSHVWNELTFDYFNNYLRASDGPISIPTVVMIDSVSGLLLHNWGKNLFYIPHGLSFDSHGNYWLTDVALHQIFCFPPNGGEKPLLTLGEKFVPGSDTEHFCKPTSVAVNENGDIFVADGYCNSRVIKFSSTGKYLNQWGEKSNMFDRHPPVGTFNLPHKIVLLEDRNMFCVADRENGRIQCFHSNGNFHFQIQREEFGGSLFSVAYAQNKGLLLAVCGRSVNDDHPVKAFMFNVTNQQLLTVFSPKSGTFSMPHDIAVSSDGEEAYVCEIGPNTVWKFLREVHKSMKKVLSSESLPSKPVHHQPTHGLPVEESSNGYNHILSSDAVDDEAKNFETSIVIMALLGIPILLLILITVIIRLRKRGRLQNVSFGHLKGWMGGYKTPHPQEKFNLGHFLNPHKGFDKVAIVESDGDEDGAGSDAEEFCVNAKNA